MTQGAEEFVHVLLFGCQECSQPLTIAIVNKEQNTEGIDVGSYTVRCSCGSTGNQIGARAKRHWVSAWHK